MDLFIGEESLLSRGIGRQVIQQFIESKIWSKFKYCIIDPDVTIFQQ